jgi:hypothetical protein
MYTLQTKWNSCHPAHAQRQKPTQLPKACTAMFLKKVILPVVQSKDRLTYFSEEREAQLFHAALRGILSAPTV